jgi:hypothetical protein
MNLLASFEEQQRRKEICKSCEHKKEYYCGICKCPLITIRKLYQKTCPKNKW